MSGTTTDLAIVGMACRFPGAANLAAFWDLVLRAQPQFGPVPARRWDHRPYHRPGERPSLGHSYTDQVAFIDEVDQFAAQHFRISARRARAMDPQQRLLLEVSREALQDAGWEQQVPRADRAGVFFAMSNSEYAELTPDVDQIEAFGVPGNLLNMAATTVSQQLDLGGPSFTVDAACSAGLVALQQAVLSLRAGDSDVALVGGAYLNLIPHSLVGFSQVGALSRTGVCRPFDERADGFVLGEGVAVLALRPVEDAVADGDRIYAVVRGIGSANDGRTDGPMTPRPEGQLLAMRRAYDDADVDPGDVTFLEAHGTATTVGDAVEIESIRRSRGSAPGCRIGAVKALVGHGLTVSGLAGLVKTALAVHHGVLPAQPTLRLSRDAADALATAGLELGVEPEPWPSTAGPRTAAVNSFGFGGTNVHVVLTQSPESGPEPEAVQPTLVVLSAGSPELLARLLDDTADAVTDETSLAAVGRTLARRVPLPTRVSFVATSVQELRETCRAVSRHLRGDGPLPRRTTLVEKAPASAPSVAFVFPGQGTQRSRMIADLRDRFAATREKLATLSVEVVAAGGPDLHTLLYGSEPASRAELARTDLCQPLLGVVGAAVTRQLHAFGVAPSVTLGHSVGEFAAAAAAGALTDKAMVRTLVARGRCIADGVASGSGGMMLVQADPAEVADLVENHEAWPACFNHPKQVTVSAPSQVVDDLVVRAKERGLPATRLAVSHGFHSPLLRSIEEPVRRLVTDLPVQTPRTTFVSSVSGTVCSDAAQLRELWDRHASSPVRFVEAARSAHDAGARVFVQLTGGSSLLSAIRASVPEDEPCSYVALTGEEPDDARTFLAGLGALWAHGVPVDLPRVAGTGVVVSLPPSSPLRRRYWTALERPAGSAAAQPQPASASEETLPAAAPSDPPVHPTTSEDPMTDVVALMREQLAVLREWESQARTAPEAAGRSLAAGSAPEPATVPAAPAAAAFPADAARAAVLEHVSAISGVPVNELGDEQLITQDLGFDSLLFTELMTRLQRSVPGWHGWPADAPRHPSVGEVVAQVAAGGEAQRAAAAAALPAPVTPAPTPVVRPVAAVEAVVEQENGLDAWSDLAEHERELAMLDPNPFFLEHQGTAAATTRIEGQEVVCFSSYNYLGLSGSEPIVDAVTEAVRTYGSSVSASRFLSGERTIHRELETELARLLGTEDAVVMVSGHATNASVIGHLVGPHDLIVHDELAHDSILQGCHASGATRRPFAHNDPEALDNVLRRLRGRHRRALVIVEGVYSMDGDIADLPAIVEVKERHGAALMVDEAHSIGTIGAGGGGIGEHFGIDRSRVDLWAGTMSKSLSSCGGYVGGSRRLVEFLKYTVPGFVYSVGMTPANAAAALGSIRTMRSEPERLGRLRDNARLFVDRARAAGLDVGPCDGSAPVVPCIVGDSRIALDLAHALLQDGVSVNPIMYPAVSEDQARLRFFVTSEHTADQIEHAVTRTAERLAQLRAASASALDDGAQAAPLPA